MQYLLSEEEYKDLLNRIEEAESKSFDLSKKKLQELCTKIADTMPIKCSWDKKREPAPWGCLITRQNDPEDPYGEWYCDDCPVQDICPYEYKDWSK